MCQNGGTCYANNFIDRFCLCQKGYVGSDCSTAYSKFKILNILIMLVKIPNRYLMVSLNLRTLVSPNLRIPEIEAKKLQIALWTFYKKQFFCYLLTSYNNLVILFNKSKHLFVSLLKCYK